MFLITIYLLLSIQNIHGLLNDYKIFFVNDDENSVAKEAVANAIDFLVDKFEESPNVTEISVQKNDSVLLLNKLCAEYQAALDSSDPPILIYDTTLYGPISEAMKYFTASLALPTISSSFEVSLLWETRDENEKQNLISMIHPAHFISRFLESFIWKQAIKDMVIFYDESFDINPILQSMLKKMNIRFIHQKIDQINENSSRYNNFSNFFIFGTLTNVQTILEKSKSISSLSNIDKWHAVSMDDGEFECNNRCKNLQMILMNPLRQGYGKNDPYYEYNLEKQFYRDLFITAYRSLNEFSNKSWATQSFTTCDRYNGNNTPERSKLNFTEAIKKQINSFEYPVDYFKLTSSRNFMKFTMQIKLIKIDNENKKTTTPLGYWNSEYDREIVVEKDGVLEDFIIRNVLRVVVVEQNPFVFVDETHPRGFNGFSIDMMERIANIININFTIHLASDNKFGDLNQKGNWNGAVRDLIDRRADISLGTMHASATRGLVIDFTVPYYEPVGFLLLMKSFRSKPSLVKFIHVLDVGVWSVSIVAFIASSVLIWIFDKYSPKSYQNNMEKYGPPKENRLFSLKESIWFSLTSMSPEGGGEIPKNMSGRIIAGTWWLFAFLFLTSYTANLSAILTVSLINNPIRSLDDMNKYSNLKYSTLRGSSAMQYFYRMQHIEKLFEKKWEEIIFLSNITELERSRLSVFTYPISTKFGDLVNGMEPSEMPNSLEEVEARIKASTSPINGFVFIGDATDCKYLSLISCDFEIIGEEFASKPYVIGVQQGSYLKASLDSAILQLLEENVLDELKNKWWNNNPNEKKCLKPENQNDGIGMKDLGGIFVTLIIGIGISCIILIFEYSWYKREKTMSYMVLKMGVNKEKIRYIRTGE